MKYVVKVNGKEYDVEVEKLGGPYQSLSRSTVYMQGVATTVQPSMISTQAPVQTQTPVQPKVVEQKQEQVASNQSSTSGNSEITSPMPGKVFKILAKEGDNVSEGQAVMILEAMKMENEIVAPQGGVIDKILVREGDMVDTDAVLVTLK